MLREYARTTCGIRNVLVRRVTHRSPLPTPSAAAPLSLTTSIRCFSVPDPSDPFTSPAGLMALLYNRTAGSTASAASPSTESSQSNDNGTNSKPPHQHGRSARRKRQQIVQKRTNAFRSAPKGSHRRNQEDEAKASPNPAGGSCSFFSTPVVALALAVFALSALWDLFTSQRPTMWAALKNSVATTLEVRSSSQEFAMIVDWMGRQPHGQRVRNLTLKPVTVQDEQKTLWRSDSVMESVDTATENDPRIMLVPGYGSHLYKFDSTWVYVTRSEDLSKQKAGNPSRIDRENDKLTLTFFTRRRAVVQQFMGHVRASWSAHVRNTVQIYLSEGYSARWRLLSERIRRPLSTLYLPRETKAVVEEARMFLGMKRTYAALGIPWRRGYLLEGPPGTGKSSFVMALAGELGMPVHMLSLRSDNMDDDALLSLVSGLPPRSILLIEDFENAIKTQKQEPGAAVQTSEVVACDVAAAVAAPPSPTVSTYSTDVGGGPRSALSLSALLNALDGVASSEGRLLLITANDTSGIPFAEALLRPGRIDRRVPFQPLLPPQMEEMERSFQQASHEGTCVVGAAKAVLSTALNDTAARVDAEKGEADLQKREAPCTPALYQQRLLDSIYAAALAVAKNAESSE